MSGNDRQLEPNVNDHRRMIEDTGAGSRGNTDEQVQMQQQRQLMWVQQQKQMKALFEEEGKTASAATAVLHKKKQAKERHRKAAGRQDRGRKEEHAEEQTDTERAEARAESDKKETENVDESGHACFGARYHWIAGFETGCRSNKSSHVTIDFAAKICPPEVPPKRTRRLLQNL